MSIEHPGRQTRRGVGHGVRQGQRPNKWFQLPRTDDAWSQEDSRLATEIEHRRFDADLRRSRVEDEIDALAE